MKGDYLRWSKSISAEELTPPDNPVTPFACSWPLFFLKRSRQGTFLDPYGRELKLMIKHPHRVDFEQELTIVQDTLKTLSPSQIKIARYYGEGVPTKQWIPVLDHLVDTYEIPATFAARIFANFHAAINDIIIVTWCLKYVWDVARPIQYDQTLKTILPTPCHPSYPSGHATVAGCAEVMLSYYFPKEANKLKQIAEECTVSRLYAGVHFPSDNEEGLQLGRYIGRVIVNRLKDNLDGNCDLIDTPVTSFRDAIIIPIIPFNYSESCSSLGVEKRNRNKRPRVSEPKLYI